MSGDNALGEVVKGAVDTTEEYGIDIILVGPKDVIKNELARECCLLFPIETCHRL